MSGEQKRHHVVPEFYLRRFANEKERITVVRRGARPHTTHVRNAGVVGKFNIVTDPGGNPSLVVEKMFADFEGLAKPIIEQIAATGHIPMHEPRSLVAQYMALQYTRTPEWRDIANIEAEIHAKTLMSAHTDASLRKMLRAMHGREPTEEEFAAAQYARDNIDEFTIEESNNDFFRAAIRLATDDVMPHFLHEMHWHLVQADDPVFITSDHPIVFHRAPGIPVGIVTAPIIYFPIDPYRTIMLVAEKRWDSPLLEPRPAAIRDINQLIADNFYEWIAYHPAHTAPLHGLEVPDDSPLMSYNGAAVYGDKRGIQDALSECPLR